MNTHNLKLNKFIPIIWLFFVCGCVKVLSAGGNGGGNFIQEFSYLGDLKSNTGNYVTFTLTDNTDPSVVVTASVVSSSYTCGENTGILLSATMPFGTNLSNLSPNWQVPEGVSATKILSNCTQFLGVYVLKNKTFSQTYFVNVGLAPITMAALRLMSNALVMNVSGTKALQQLEPSTAIVNVANAVSGSYTTLVTNFNRINNSIDRINSTVTTNLNDLVMAPNTLSVKRAQDYLNIQLSLIEQLKTDLLNLISDADINITVAQTHYSLLNNFLELNQTISGPFSVQDLIDEISPVLKGDPSLISLIKSSNLLFKTLNTLKTDILLALSQDQNKLTTIYSASWQSAVKYYANTSLISYNNGPGGTPTSAYWLGFNDAKLAQYAADSDSENIVLRYISGAHSSSSFIPAAGFGSYNALTQGAQSACSQTGPSTIIPGYYLNTIHLGNSPQTATHSFRILHVVDAKNAFLCQVVTDLSDGGNPAYFLAPDHVAQVIPPTPVQFNNYTHDSSTNSLLDNAGNTYYFFPKERDVMLGVLLSQFVDGSCAGF